MGPRAFWVKGGRTRFRNDSRWFCVRVSACTLKAKEMICEVIKASLSADACTLGALSRLLERCPRVSGWMAALGQGLALS